jgi:hypothetical protein
LQKGEVVEMVSVCQPLGLLEHLWHEIQTVNVGHTDARARPRCAAPQATSSTTSGAVRGDGLNDPGQPAGGKSSLGERRRLPTKLCADTIVMARNGHEGNVAPATLATFTPEPARSERGRGPRRREAPREGHDSRPKFEDRHLVKGRFYHLADSPRSAD